MWIKIELNWIEYTVSGTLKPCPRGQSGLFPNCTGNKNVCYSLVRPNVKVRKWYVENRQYLFQCPVYKNLSLSSACFFLLVLRRADFPFDQVPVPSVTYIDDTEITVTLNCDFKVPPWGNVSFEIQWFVNGNASKPAAQCDDPLTSECSLLRHYEYGLGSHVNIYIYLFELEKVLHSCLSFLLYIIALVVF